MGAEYPPLEKKYRTRAMVSEVALFFARDYETYSEELEPNSEHAQDNIINYYKNVILMHAKMPEGNAGYACRAYVRLLNLAIAAEQIDEVEKLSEKFYTSFPDCYDSLYFKLLSVLIRFDVEKKKILSPLYKYFTSWGDKRKYIQPGMLSPDGFHVDMIIGRILFESGRYKDLSDWSNKNKRELIDYIPLQLSKEIFRNQ
ncbi:hypothetical protein [Chromobacterium vaccinii]|uniref:hypothetical protein n=1 Tax=Chromobacterium vaccinii TaxID=1108595 RepID=UPI0011C028A5|nr:hypothetical protein [Chromobacterium vaccinii]